MIPKRIAYITEASPNDKHSWSGTAHYVYQALIDHGFKLIPLGPARPSFLRYFLAFANKMSLVLFKKRLDYRHMVIYSRAFGRIFNAGLKNLEYDMIVVCGGTECGAYLNTTKPIYYVLDRTIEGALNYHTILSGLWDFSEKQSIYTDKKAMQEASLLFFSSRWAADHAKNNYGIADNKIRVLPFGANLDHVPSRQTALKSKDTSQWRLLLVGTYWENKGADIAYNALIFLLKNNVNATLTVVGCVPPDDLRHERLKIIPFIDKNSDEGLKELSALFLSHHFFILPTRFDCTPIVFCEAASFGLPVLTADTGGVAGHVKEGVNGFLLPYDDQGEGYANKIKMLIDEPGRYEQLCLTSRDLYESDLNWNRWVQAFSKAVCIPA